MGAASKALDQAQPFDLCVIDEAAMALEVSCWLPLLRAKRLCLAGDHCQLPPTIKSDNAMQAGLGRTLFERLLSLDQPQHPSSAQGGDGGEGSSGAKFDAQKEDVAREGKRGNQGLARLLAVQYRMHATISDWASHYMYQGRLQSAPSVAKRTLADFPHVKAAMARSTEQDDNHDDVLLSDDLLSPLVLIDTSG